MKPYNETSCTVVLSDDRRIEVVVKNYGWDGFNKAYATVFAFDGVFFVSLFKTTKHEQQHCSRPAERLAFDNENLERAVKLRTGADLTELELEDN